jgi:hypothetical protein
VLSGRPRPLNLELTPYGPIHILLAAFYAYGPNPILLGPIPPYIGRGPPQRAPIPGKIGVFSRKNANKLTNLIKYVIIIKKTFFKFDKLQKI